MTAEPCRLCINWVNGSECEIDMPQSVCPSRSELRELVAERDKLSLSNGNQDKIIHALVGEKNSLSHRLTVAESALREAHTAMVGFHCSTFAEFPDKEHCGVPAKTKTCHNYWLCDSMKKALTCASCTKTALGQSGSSNKGEEKNG